MSYSFTVYTDRASIETTKVYSQTAGTTYTYNYGTGQHNLNGFTDGHYLRFTAVPADGYEFKRWIYHIGSPSATTQYSTSNPFQYYGSTGNDIYIAAEGQATSGGGSGGGDDSQWTVYTHTQEHMDMSEWSSSGTDIEIYPLKEYSLHIFSVEFAHSGYAHFYTESDIDTIGYLSGSTQCNDGRSEPLSILASNDDDGDGRNFDIKYYVTAGTTYYIFVRGYSGEETGSVTLYVTQPWELNSKSYGTLSGSKTESISVSRPYTLYCRTVSFSKSGTVTISASGVPGIRGWLGPDSNWDYGQPTGYYTPKTESSSLSKFTNSYDVVAGQVYYIWFASYSITNGGYTCTLNISSEEENIDYFEWSSAVAQGLPVKNVSHTEWDSFIDKIKEVLTAKNIINQPLTSAKYGYAVGTTLKTMLNDCYLTYDTDLQGYPLTAKKFNVARFIIGSYAPGGSGIAEDKVSNTSKVLASDFIKLENSLKAWQDN